MRSPRPIPATSLALLLLLAVPSGCATRQRMVFDKPGVSPAEQRRDESECLRSAVAQDTAGRPFLLVDLDREEYIRCMQGRGSAAAQAQRQTRARVTMRPARKTGTGAA